MLGAEDDRRQVFNLALILAIVYLIADQGRSGWNTDHQSAYSKRIPRANSRAPDSDRKAEERRANRAFWLLLLARQGRQYDRHVS
jgi:hypothetical protein